jgi:hypothetical protein
MPLTNTQFANALRQMADFYEQHAEMPQPETFLAYSWRRTEFLRAVKMLGAVKKLPVDKNRVCDDHYFKVEKRFGDGEGFPLELITMRADICTKVTKMVETTTWECPDSLLEQLAEMEAKAKGEGV